MTDDANLPVWNGIPDDSHQTGWHWIGYPGWMEAVYWDAHYEQWNIEEDGFMFAGDVYRPEQLEYLGPCTPPISRCRDGTPRVAVSAEVRDNSDEIHIRMNDGTTHYIDRWFWHNGQPAFEIVGKTVPEINAAADEYRDPKQEESA